MEWMRELLSTQMGLLMLTANYSPTDEKIIDVLLGEWVAIFTSAIGRIDEGLDTPRILKAFELHKRKDPNWPAPAQIIELMPRRPEREQMTYDPPADAATARSAFAICQRVIDGEITVEEANELLAGTDAPDREEPF